MQKVKVKIYKPLLDNYMQELDYDTCAQFEQMLLNNAGGFTKTQAKGSWLDAFGDRINDAVEVYEMIVDNNPSIIANLRAQALVIKQEMQQDCVLFTVEPMLEVEFVC